MVRPKTDFAIVNRGFWPRSQVIGEALLRLAEKAAETRAVTVITQSEGSLQRALSSADRGKSLRVMDSRARSDSSSGLIRRILDAAVFMCWVFISLIRVRPARIYVSTNPPVVVPFVVFLYARLLGAKYIYHVQDIHPEAANIVVRVNPLVYRVLRWADGVVLRNAESLITLSDDMKREIKERSQTSAPVHLLDNPAPSVEPSLGGDRKRGIVFCGNAGRLQRMPLVLDSIHAYLEEGGRMAFTFVGGGVYAPRIQELAGAFQQVTYHGFLPADQASDIVKKHAWGLMPIDDEVTRYAFPSKSSTYVVSGCNVLAVCGEHTSVARWVEENKVGVACPPNQSAVLSKFRKIEQDGDDSGLRVPDSLKEKLAMATFVDRVAQILDAPVTGSTG